MHQYQDLIMLFNRCFLNLYNTQLSGGKDEPLYQPADESLSHHTIFFAHDYFASALHECSHWLLAGDKRRQQVDYGYWYEPDGRTAEQQELFLLVEVKPQALEWILSQATNFRFRVSLDNINGVQSNCIDFKRAVYQQVKMYCEKGLSAKAESFRLALCQFYNTSPTLQFENFDFAIL